MLTRNNACCRPVSHPVNRNRERNGRKDCRTGAPLVHSPHCAGATRYIIYYMNIYLPYCRKSYKIKMESSEFDSFFLKLRVSTYRTYITSQDRELRKIVFPIVSLRNSLSIKKLVEISHQFMYWVDRIIPKICTSSALNIKLSLT